jgi:hypothetical protein
MTKQQKANRRRLALAGLREVTSDREERDPITMPDGEVIYVAETKARPAPRQHGGVEFLGGGIVRICTNSPTVH